MSRRVTVVFTCLALASCQQRRQPALAPAPTTIPADVPGGPDNPRSQAVWEALLRAYMAHAVRSEGDITLWANRATNFGEQRDRADVVFMVRTDPASQAYDREWLASLLPRGLVNGVCAALRPELCTADVMTSFLSFSEPEFTSDTTAVVRITDRALNPSACGGRRRGMPGTGGEMRVRASLVKRGDEWCVNGGEIEEGATIPC
jgi:hypothetical protein